jgi:hypothetical protein
VARRAATALSLISTPLQLLVAREPQMLEVATDVGPDFQDPIGRTAVPVHEVDQEATARDGDRVMLGPVDIIWISPEGMKLLTAP